MRGKYIKNIYGENQITLILFLMITLFLVSLSLSCSGDIGSNPGTTYSIIKIICGSFHQGNPRFGHTAGIQYVCNSPYALLCSLVNCTNGIQMV